MSVFFKYPVSSVFLFFFAQSHVDSELESYLIILVLDPEVLSQVSEHLWAVLFEFKLSWKILSEEEKQVLTHEMRTVQLDLLRCDILYMFTSYIVLNTTQI